MTHRSIVLLAGCAFAGSLTASQASINAELIVTSKSAEVFRAWEHPDGKKFEVTHVKIANRGEFLAAIVLFKDCKADVSGNCNVSLDIAAFDPSGKVYGEMLGKELWRGKAAPRSGHTQLGVDYMGLVIEPNDPAGTYKVTVKLTDLNANTELNVSTQFDVK